MNQKYDCPNCGGAVVFQSSVAVFAVCPYCRSMVVRHDLNVEAIGVMAALPPDLSPLQIGTKGELAGRAFTLIGRVRLAYDEGSWTEWYALFGDNTYGWVGETQGFFTVGFQIDLPPGFPRQADDLPVGAQHVIGKEAFNVTDRKATVCLWGEGELPFVAKPKRGAMSIDLTGAGGLFASVEWTGTEVRVFSGRYARFDDLHFSNLRPVPGWSEEVIEPVHGQTTGMNCPKCGATVELRAAGFSMSATCGSCHSLIDTSTPDLQLIRMVEERKRLTPRIPVGRRGELFGVSYEMIGFQHVMDSYTGWFEYLLFNPWQGFVWLVNYQGHWTFINRLYERPEILGGLDTMPPARFHGETYRIFDRTEVRTDYVVGEFYWKVALGMKVQVADFIKPPKILSRESYAAQGEETWSQGIYILPEVVREAFKLEEPMREPSGIYLNQPNPHAEKARQLAWLLPAVLVLLLAIQFISAKHAEHKQVFSADYIYFQGFTNPMVVSEPFTIAGGNQALHVLLNAPVNNNWIELDVDFVNSNSTVAANFVQGIEAYHGSDSDGPWSEGRQREKVLVPDVAPGTYHLNVDVAADASIKEMPFSITIIRDVTVWSNFWIALAAVLIYPAYRLTRAVAFEKARWEESDYPTFFNKAGNDDD